VCNRIFPYTLILGHIRIYSLNQFDTFCSWDLTIYPFPQVATKYRVLSKNITPKNFTRTQLRVTDIHESDDTLQAEASTAEHTTPTVLPEAGIDDDDDLENDLGGQRRKGSLIDNDSCDLRSQITDEDRLDVATQNRLMLEMLPQNDAQWKAEQRLERERMAAEHEPMAAKQDQWAAKRAKRIERRTVGPRANIYKMVDPVRFCGGAKELDRFLDTLRSNFNSHGHLFPHGGPDYVKYAISLLHGWSNNQNPTLRESAMTDHSERAGNLSAESDPCLKDFDLFSQDMANVCMDKDRRRVAVITLMQGYIQLPPESVRGYANHFKADWRQAGWNLLKHEEVLYDIAWAGLRNSLKNKAGLMTPACGRFDTLDEFIDQAVPSEVTHVQNKKPQQQQQRQQQQQQKKQPTDSSSKDSKTRLPAIHLLASRHHRRQIMPIGIKQTRQIRRRRTIVRPTTSTMGLNGNLRKPTYYRQMPTMQISEPQGELLP
jgi:hypothetical protein